MKPYETPEYKIKVSPAPETAMEEEDVSPVKLFGAYIASAIFGGALMVIVGIVCFGIFSLLGGCAVERADPAARSNRAIYTLTVTAHGDNSHAEAYISDGLLATADGEGAITQPSTQTATQNPDLSGAAGPLAAGITAAARVGTAAIGAYADVQKAKAGKGNAAKGGAADCEGGACTPDAADCPDCEPDGDCEDCDPE